MARVRRLLACVVGLISVAGAEGCGRPSSPAASPPAPRAFGKPPTEEECRAAGEAIARAVEAADGAAFDRMFDRVSMYRRVTAGIDAPDKFRNGFVQGLEQANSSGKGLSGAIVGAVRKGGSYKLLHAHAQDGQPRLLFRLLLPDSGVNYHDLILARATDGKVKVADIYVYLSGELLSETFRRPYLQAVAQENAGVLGRITGKDQAFAKNYGKVGEMSAAIRAGRFPDALRAYEAMPADFRKDKNVQILRLQAAQSGADEREHEQAIVDLRTDHPGEACIDLISIDYYLLKKQFGEALACIDRLDRSVLGDPYLQVMRANVHIAQEDLAAAEADARKALEADPDLVDADWSLVTISLNRKDHGETLRLLRLIRDRFGISIGDPAAEPAYKDFAGSPEYREWVKDGQGEAKPVEKGKPEE